MSDDGLLFAALTALEAADIPVSLRTWTRFWNHVRWPDDLDQPVEELCWEWGGGTRAGYGAFKFEGETHGAHRLLMQWLHGPLTGLDVDHLCGNPPCVRPSHLDVVTRSENMLRGSDPHFEAVAS